MLRWLVALAALVVLSPACGDGPPDPATTNTDAPSPTTTPSHTATPSPTAIPPTPTPTPVPPPAVSFVTQGSPGLSVVRADWLDDDIRVERQPWQMPITEIAIAPGARFAAYSQAATLTADVVAMDLETGYAVNITGSPGVDDQRPAWSPDGQYVAYRSVAEGEVHMTVRTSGTWAEVASLAIPAGAYDVRWLPGSDGFSYLLPTGSGEVDLHRLLLDGTHLDGPAVPGAVEAAYAPDTVQVAVIRRDAEAEPPVDELLLIDLESGDARPVAPGLGAFGRLRWSPDGRSLSVLAANEDGDAGLYIIEADLAPWRVYAGRVDDWAWSPAGDAIALVADGGECGPRTCPRGFLRILDLGTEEVAGLPDIRVLGTPAWHSPAE